MLKKHQVVDKGEECVTLPVAESRAISRPVLCGCDNRAKRNWSKGQMGVEILPLFHLPCHAPMGLYLFRGYCFLIGTDVPYGLFWPFPAFFSVAVFHSRV